LDPQMPTADRPESRMNLILRAARSEPVARVPVWMMRQAGRYLPEYRALRERHSFLDLCKRPELAAEVSLQPFRILGVDAVIVFSDILIPAEAMGLPLELTDAGPVLPRPVQTAADVAALRHFDPEVETRFLCDALRMICRGVGPHVPVIGFAAAPWTLLCYMVEGRTKEGFSAAKQLLYSEPALCRTLLEKIARITATYLRAQIAAGASVVQLFDTWAGELSLADYEAFELPATQLLLGELEPGLAPVILYSKGTAHLLPSLAETGASVLSVDWRVDLAEARRRFGHRVALQGNVDPCVLLGPDEGVREAAVAAIRKTDGLGHILNLGHGILPQTPVENARLFVETARSTPLPVRVAGGERV
jgi:uroporphyrinogen decarboxylase